MNRYFDTNATTPLSEAAREAWLKISEKHWHNPSSLYREAGVAKRHLEDCREQLGDLLGCEPERIVFTSGATEANNLVFELAARQTETKAGRVLISGVEHPSVRESARKWFGKERLVELPVTADGGLDLSALEKELNGGVALVSVMAANNETGVLQPWEAVRDLCAKAGVPFHCDAAQWLGKLRANGLGDCPFLTGSAHKFGGPKGTGFLLVPEDGGTPDFAGLTGGPQEGGRRAGTEDLASIAAMVTALEEASALLSEAFVREKNADRDWFDEEARQRIPGLQVVAPKAPRLWNTTMLVLPRHQNLKWLTRLSRLGFAVSTGSACSSGKENPSHVMEAMGLDYDKMGRVMRLSGAWATTREDWAALLEALENVWNELESGVRPGGKRGRVSLTHPDPTSLFSE